jgi:hypothetical protein
MPTGSNLVSNKVRAVPRYQAAPRPQGTANGINRKIPRSDHHVRAELHAPFADDDIVLEVIRLSGAPCRQHR